jgi:hypothetical protein
MVKYSTPKQKLWNFQSLLFNYFCPGNYNTKTSPNPLAGPEKYIKVNNLTQQIKTKISALMVAYCANIPPP